MSKQKRYYRKIIRIRAEDSPNVQLGLAEVVAGKEPSHRELVPGILSYAAYMKRRKMWDKVKQCVSLDGEFYEGAEELLFPPEWLNNAEKLYSQIGNRRKAKAIGVDTAFGGDDTVMTAVDEKGIIDYASKKTPNTAVITGEVLAFARKNGVPDKMVFFDAGGGGQAHVDRLRQNRHLVIAVSFGAAASPERKRGLTQIEKKKQEDWVRWAYKNKRAEMYGITSRVLDPNDGGGFAIPLEYVDLRQQLAPIPRLYTGEGQLWLPPKEKDRTRPNLQTMHDLIGRSPDDADALVLAVYGLQKGRISKGGGPVF